ncbi:MAG TPA: chloride channel protein [Acidimicrobiales bacterium]|nr:chloride channel protein [Acidimicrobiales bacterium]
MNGTPAAGSGAGGVPARTTGGDRLRLAGRHHLWRVGARVNRMAYLPKWLILASVIGVIAGVGAIVFFEALRLATAFFLGLLAGYHVPTPALEGNAAGSAGYARPWAIPLVVTLGGVLSGFTVFTWAPEAEGHGTDAAIDAVHHNPRMIRVRAIIVKIVASAMTIGSGGSGGREGPTAQVSAGFGSLLARVLDLSPEDGRIAVSVGVGSGIGAIFSAPLGGAVLAADIVYREDFETAALLPGMFASIVAYAIFGGVYGYGPLFGVAGAFHFQGADLAWFAIIGLLAGGIGLLYSKGFYGVVDFTKRLPFTRKLRPAAGGLLVGLMALWLPEVLGTGYGWIQKALDNGMLHVPLYIIVLLPFARIAATAFSIGTGGSGGVFGPGMVIGAFTGLAVWRILEPIAPAVGHDPAPYVIVGMMAVFGGISRAPLAVMIMVAEMTGTVAMLIPAMVAVAIAWFIVRHFDDSIYRSQLLNRYDSPGARLQFGLPLLATRTVAMVARPPRVVLASSTSATEALQALRRAGLTGAPVVDEQGIFLGGTDVDRLVDVVGERDEEATAGSAADATSVTVAATATLDVGIEAIMQARQPWIAVTGGDRKVVGILSASDIVDGYRQALEEDARRLSLAGPHAVALDLQVGRRSRLAGHRIAQAGFPQGCLVVSVRNDDGLRFATGTTRLDEGDTLSVLVRPENADEVRRLVGGEKKDESDAESQGADPQDRGERVGEGENPGASDRDPAASLNDRGREGDKGEAAPTDPGAEDR